MNADLAQRALYWIKQMMVDGEYDKRFCCWTDPDRSHRPDCELRPLIKELERAAHQERAE